jgi:hypothetical protein
MKEVTAWLLHDDQKVLFEIVFAIILNVIFLAVLALALWLLDRTALASHLAKGYGILWIATFVTAILIARIHHIFRVNLYDRSGLFLVSNLLASSVLQTGWAAFAALTVRGFVDGAPGWMIVSLYLSGAVSCIVAFFAVSSFYQGHFYRLISLPLGLVGFLVFSVWPASGRALYGWFFDLF